MKVRTTQQCIWSVFHTSSEKHGHDVQKRLESAYFSVKVFAYRKFKPTRKLKKNGIEIFIVLWLKN